MKKEDYDYGLPRLFVGYDLEESTTLSLDEDSAHYLKNVLRRPDGSKIRIFNGRQGEFLAAFSARDKKNTHLAVEQKIRAQKERNGETHLIFAPIKKDRQDFLIEKAVELGATHLHPVLTQQTVIRDLNEKRVLKQIQEAAEQCERLDIPQLAPLMKLTDFLQSWPNSTPILAALERTEAPPLDIAAVKENAAILIGPEGGFSEDERTLLLKNEKIHPVNLGEEILRAETAALFGLSILKMR